MTGAAAIYILGFCECLFLIILLFWNFEQVGDQTICLMI